MQFSDDKDARPRQLREGILMVEEAASNEVDYEQVLEKIGFGKTQWMLLLISGLQTITSMAAQTSVGIIAIASQCEFEMNQAQKGVMMAACVTGIFLSTYFWGYVSDAYGRRSVLLFGTFFTNLLQLVTMFVTNIWVFNILNLIMGISLGGVSGAMYPYLSEFNTAKYRAVVINYSTMFVSFTSVYVPATAWLVLSADWSFTVFEGFVFRPWRLIILLSLLPGFIGSLMLLPFPESPKLLLSHHKEKKAAEAVSWICKFNTGRSVASVLKNDDFKLKPDVEAEEDILGSSSGCGVLVSIWRATVPLVYKPHGVNFMISAAVMFGLFFSSSGVQIWYPEIVNRSASTTGGNSSTVCEILDASFANEMPMNGTSMQDQVICDDHITTRTYIDNMIVGAAFMIGFTIQGALLNILGRKNVLLAALSIATLSGILLQFVSNSTVVLILFCLYLLMPGLAISIMCGAAVDLVPTHLRGKAVSICLTLGRMGVIVSSNLVGIMMEPLCKTTFGLFSAGMLVCVVLVQFLPI